MRIYLDVCCLNRPHDDQSQLRVRLETAAVIEILKRCETGEWTWVMSEIVEIEVRRDPWVDRRRRTTSQFQAAAEYIKVDDGVVARALGLTQKGLKFVDALHVALAISARCEVLLTTDDRLTRASQRLHPSIPLRVRNPLEWWQENDR